MSIVAEQKRLLLVDDEADILAIAQVSLTSLAGWDVQTASSGAECLERVRADRPDAVILDVMMPDMDGPATFRALRDDPETRDLPVVMMTAKVQPAERARLAELGVDGVLAKPFDPMELHRQIADVLGWEL